jgi:ABC-type proline/glycine betaine transport system ATPase subunit
MTAHKTRVGLVSEGTPLISNLNVWANIALIPQYHRNMPWREAEAYVGDLLDRLDMLPIAYKRNSALTNEERFCAMVLRAAMVEDSILVLDRPFKILSNLRDSGFMMDTLQKVDALVAETHIFDYTWEKDRYGVSDDKEN